LYERTIQASLGFSVFWPHDRTSQRTTKTNKKN